MAYLAHTVNAAVFVAFICIKWNGMPALVTFTLVSASSTATAKLTFIPGAMLAFITIINFEAKSVVDVLPFDCI